MNWAKWITLDGGWRVRYARNSKWSRCERHVSPWNMLQYAFISVAATHKNVFRTFSFENVMGKGYMLYFMTISWVLSYPECPPCFTTSQVSLGDILKRGRGLPFYTGTSSLNTWKSMNKKNILVFINVFTPSPEGGRTVVLSVGSFWYKLG